MMHTWMMWAVLASLTVCALSTGGSLPSTDVDNCDSQPCQNGGMCTSLPAGYNCSCPHGYEGTQCERVWLNAVEYNQLKRQISQATQELESLKQLIAQRQRLVDQTILQTLDGILAVEGPRFFKEWRDINLSNVSQVRSFSIGEKQFLGAINTNTNSSHQYHEIIIYEILDDSLLVHIQTISEKSPVSFKYFSIDNNQFIAVANYLPMQSNPEHQSVLSRLYKWNGTLFNKVQDIPTEGAKDVDFINIRNSRSFLVFSGHHNRHSYNTSLLVYVWIPNRQMFNFYQKLPTTAAQKVHFLKSGKETYLTVASEYDRHGNGHTNSSIFQWNGTHFNLFGLVPTYHARDLYPLRVGCHLFVVAANFFHNASYNVISTIYRLDNGNFVEHASFEGAVAAESFTIETEYFLAVANSVNKSSVLYKLTGPSLVHFQEIPMSSVSYIHAFTLKSGCKALAVSNSAGKAKLYKWTRIGVLKNSCCE